MPTEATATCGGLVRIYRTASGEVHALKGIDATFPGAAVTAVVGPSGAGKSTLLRILAGLDRPTAGSVRIGDRSVTTLGARALRKVRRSSVGYVFQRPSDNLIADLTASEHVDMAARLRGIRDHARGVELLELLGLQHRLEHRPHQLSGGEQQRLAFAQAVVGDPPLVVADEPTAELDSATGERLLDAIALLAGRGTSVVVATHDPRVVAAADKTLHLRHGALEAETEGRTLSVIDEAGRIQLPPRALELFRERRAVIEVDEDHVRLEPP